MSFASILIKYSLNGLLVAAVYMICYCLMTYIINVGEFYAFVVTYFVTVVSQYMIQGHMTFDAKLLDKGNIARFLVLTAFNLLLGYMITLLCIKLGLARWATGLLTMGCLAAVSVVAMMRLVFATKRP